MGDDSYLSLSLRERCPAHGTQRADHREVYFMCDIDIDEVSRVRCRFPNSFVDDTNKCGLDRWMEATGSGIGGICLLIRVSLLT